MRQLSFNFEEEQPLELCNEDILPETYIMHRIGGKHPFYGVPNAHPSYQELIWPYIKRINYPKNRQTAKGEGEHSAQSLVILFFDLVPALLVSGR